MGVDLGTKRIGIALSDPTGMVASPLLVIARKGGKQDLQEVVRLARDYDVESIVVGLPVDLKGELGVAAQKAQTEIEQLRTLAAPVPVQAYDERLTSAAAQRAMSDSGVDSRQQRGQVDKVAAALLLQSYLDRQRHQDASPPEQT
jgi:putative Holliday junction resolvase